MSSTLMSSPTGSVSTSGIQSSYELSGSTGAIDRLRDGLRVYGAVAAYPESPVTRRRVSTTWPIRRARYFTKAPQSLAIACYYFRGHDAFSTQGEPPEIRALGINSSLREVGAMLFFKAMRAQSTGNDSAPLFRPEHVMGQGGSGTWKTWIAQEEMDFSTEFQFACLHPANQAVAELVRCLTELGQLSDGWNSYTAAPPSVTAIENAKRLLTAACAIGIIAERVEPSAMGGVGVTFTAGSREAVVEFYNAGAAHSLFADNATHDLDTSPVTPTGEGYGRLLDKVRQYLYGHAAAKTSGSKIS